MNNKQEVWFIDTHNNKVTSGILIEDLADRYPDFFSNEVTEDKRIHLSELDRYIIKIQRSSAMSVIVGSNDIYFNEVEAIQAQNILLSSELTKKQKEIIAKETQESEGLKVLTELIKLMKERN